MNIRPLRDYLAVRPFDMERELASGIVIPEMVKEKPMKGEVVAVGPGKIGKGGTIRPLDVSVGDKIMFSPNGHREINGSNLFLIQEASIIGFLE